MKYELVGDDQCLGFFYLDSDLGSLSLKKLIEDPNIVSFTVGNIVSMVL